MRLMSSVTVRRSGGLVWRTCSCLHVSCALGCHEPLTGASSRWRQSTRSIAATISTPDRFGPTEYLHNILAPCAERATSLRPTRHLLPPVHQHAQSPSFRLHTCSRHRLAPSHRANTHRGIRESLADEKCVSGATQQQGVAVVAVAAMASCDSSC